MSIASPMFDACQLATSANAVTVGNTCANQYKSISFDQLESDPSWPMIVAEYADECRIAGMPACEYQGDMYRMLESQGVMHLIGAYVGDTLVGFCNLLLTRLPHYGKVVGTMESMFVAKNWRKSGAGIGLIREAERVSANGGAVAVLMTAPTGGSMERLMPMVGYRHTNTVFFKALEQ